MVAEYAHKIGWDQRSHGQHCKDAIVIGEVECTGKQYLHEGHHHSVGAAADQKLFAFDGVGYCYWVDDCIGHCEVDTGVVADFNTVYAFYLFLNNQPICPDQTGQNIKTAENAPRSQICHHIMPKIRLGAVLRVPQSCDVFPTGCEYYPYAACNYSWYLCLMDGNTIQQRIQYEHTQRSTDIEDIDDWERYYIVHGCEAYLIDEHGGPPGQQPFIICASFEIYIHSHPSEEEIVCDEDSDASDKVGLHRVIVPFRDIDEAEGVHHSSQKEEQVGEIIPAYLLRDAFDPSLNYLQSSILIFLGLFFHVII